ncbi:MAG: ROK family protein [Bacteroidales bacterium]
MKSVAIGVDIGGTNTAIGIIDRDGNVLNSRTIPTPGKQENPSGSQSLSDDILDRYILKLSSTISEMITAAKNTNDEIIVEGIGLGAPNGNYYNGTIEFAPNLPFVGIVNIVDLLQAKHPDLRIIKLTNDANAAAIGEMIYGGAKGMNNFVMYTLGTGVGSGIVVNGDLVYGHDGFAGECGHTTLIPNGRHCGCGIPGHLEAYCSASGMKRTAFELLAFRDGYNSELAEYSYKEMTSKTIYEAAISGDEIALEVFRRTGEYLGQGMADTVHHLSPEAIFIFGGPTAAGEVLFDPVRKGIQKYLLPIFNKPNGVKIVPSKLKLGDAAIMGASALVWQEMQKE